MGGGKASISKGTVSIFRRLVEGMSLSGGVSGSGVKIFFFFSSKYCSASDTIFSLAIRSTST